MLHTCPSSSVLIGFETSTKKNIMNLESSNIKFRSFLLELKLFSLRRMLYCAACVELFADMAANEWSEMAAFKL